MNSSSIYDDLNNTDLGEKVDKLKEQNEKLRSHIKNIEGDIEKLCKELTKMKRNEDNLKKNISSLFNTSKVEIERKNRMIAELRKQLDDLLFKRSNVYSNTKCSGQQHVLSEGPNFNKRRYESSEPELNINKRLKCELQNNTKIIKAQPVVPLKPEKHQEITREHGSSRSYSNSPSRQERSRNRYRHSDSKRSRSKSKDKHHSQGRDRSRERDRSRSKKPHKNHNRNEKDDNLYPKDLREVLSTRKLNEKTILKSSVSDKNCNIVIKEALNRISSKHNDHVSTENNSSNLKYKSDAKNYETANTHTEIIELKNEAKKNHGKGFDNKHKTVKTETEDKHSSAIRNKSSNYEISKKRINTELNSENNQNSVIGHKNGKLKDDYSKIDNDTVILDKEPKSSADLETKREECNDKTSRIEENWHVNAANFANHATNNTLDDNILDTKVAVQTSTNNTETKLDIKEGLGNDEHEHNITITNISSNRTSINASRRRRCVLKMLT